MIYVEWKQTIEYHLLKYNLMKNKIILSQIVQYSISNNKFHAFLSPVEQIVFGQDALSVIKSFNSGWDTVDSAFLGIC